MVEDPGAANFVADLPEHLASHGYDVALFAGANAVDQLAALKTGFNRLPEIISPQIFLNHHEPDLLMTGTSENPDAAGLRLIDAAKSLGVPVICAVDSPANPLHRLRGKSKDSLRHAPDWLLVPDRFTEQAFADAGFDRKKLFVVGHPHFDRVLQALPALRDTGRAALRRRHFPGELETRKIVLFLSEISDGLAPEQFRRSPAYTLTGWWNSIKRTDIVFEEMLEGIKPFRSDLSVYVRLHPKNTAGEFEKYRPYFDDYSSGEDAMEAVYAADLVIGMSTSLLMEAALLGRPTLSILPRDIEKTWAPSVAAGMTPCCLTRADVVKSIAGLMESDLEKRRDIHNSLPTGCLDRISDTLNRILQ